MKRVFRKAGSIFTALLAFVISFGGGQKQRYPSGKQSIYDFTVKSIDGESVDLSQYRGKKMLIVNTASECGYTPQYAELQELHEKYGDRLAVIAFPSNDFGGQEPGSGEEIKNFCQKNYGVTFPVMEKVKVKGKDMHPLYRWLSNKEENGTCNDLPDWNFCKYLIDENGKIIKFFRSKTKPLDAELTSLL